jgi:hypothetical protein
MGKQNLRARLSLIDRTVSLLEEQVDVAVRVVELPDSSMIATRVGLIRQSSVPVLLIRTHPAGR